MGYSIREKQIRLPAFTGTRLGARCNFSGEDRASIERRLETARRELARAGEYQYEIINDDLDEAVGQLDAIVHRHFSR